MTGDSTTGTADEAAAARERRTCVEIGTQRVEDVLVENQAGSGRDVGGRGQDERAIAPVEIGEGRAVEEDFVIQIGRQFRAPPARSTTAFPSRPD